MSVDEKTVKYAKLEWYKEVLSLEPNSKLFLPLARLLAELGTEDNNADMMNEAFEVLRRGLDIQPEFMEARLFLIELLNTCGCKAQCGAEVARLASLFLSYPDFWDAWREYAITENESSDFTAALGFMSAIMRNKSLSIVQVLEAGLNSLKTNSAPIFSPETINIAKNIEKSGLAKMPSASVAQIKTTMENVSAQEEPASQDDFAQDEAEDAADFAEEKEIMPSELADVLPKGHVENYMNFAEQQSALVQDKTKSTKETLAELIKDANITIEPVENSLFRTKSMADLLAEQGDYKGALEIYKELLAKGYGNKEELEERIADIKMLAPELDVKIDTSKLLAIDDLVDTSFGTMAESLSTMQAGNREVLAEENPDLNIVQEESAQAEDLSVFAENEPAMETEPFMPAIEDEQVLQPEPAETVEVAELAEQAQPGLDLFDENEISAEEKTFAENAAENIVEEIENTADIASFAETEEPAVQNEEEKKVKSQADVADLLTKLAERLEIRAS